MNTQFSNRTRSFAFLSALFLMLVAAAPSAMAREAIPNTHTTALAADDEPGCD